MHKRFMHISGSFIEVKKNKVFRRELDLRIKDN